MIDPSGWEISVKLFDFGYQNQSILFLDEKYSSFASGKIFLDYFEVSSSFSIFSTFNTNTFLTTKLGIINFLPSNNKYKPSVYYGIGFNHKIAF